jgi:hypothetical protein
MKLKMEATKHGRVAYRFEVDYETQIVTRTSAYCEIFKDQKLSRVRKQLEDDGFKLEQTGVRLEHRPTSERARRTHL